MFDEEEFMEFLWQNGQSVMNKTVDKHNSGGGGATENTLIPEDEMASWLAADQGYHARDYSTTVIGSSEIPAAVEPQLVRALLAAAGDLGTSASTSAELPPLAPREDRKRKGKESRDVESKELEVAEEAKKQVHGSPSNKRSRSAQVHNLSERRRRDRINEKMKALRELIPRCNKTDKASLLDDATKYLKSLQRTVQMMLMGYGMMPAVCPGVQQYVPRMPIGTSRPIMPYPLQAPASSEFFGQNFPVPAFSLQALFSSDQTIAQATSQSDPLLYLHQLQIPSETQISNFHIYQHYLGVHEGPLPLSQNQATMQQSRSKPRSISEVQYHDDGPYSGMPANFIV